MQEALKHEGKRDHFGNLEKICIRCQNKSKGNVMSSEHEALVIKYLYSDYVRDRAYLPCGLCTTCRLLLQQWDREGKNSFDYKAIL